MNGRLSLSWVAAFAILSVVACSKPSTTTCPGTTKSDGNGNCVECTATTDCAAGTYCNAGVCASCAGDPSACDGRCRGDDDCAAGNYCDNGTCQSGCRSEADCPAAGQICNLSNHACVAGCSATKACAKSSDTCCNGTCVNVKTSTAHCGACEAPACEVGNQCCGGTCSDTQTDAAHCGGCNKPACPGSDACIDGACDSDAAALMIIDAHGIVPGDSMSTEARVVNAAVILKKGLPSTSACLAEHIDSAGSDDDAGIVTFSGFVGGPTIGGGPDAPTVIECTHEEGRYRCGWGPATDGKPGPDLSTLLFDPTATPVGPGEISMKNTGGANVSTFDVTAQVGTELATTADLSALDFYGANNITVPVNCGGGSCGFNGMPVLVVEATSNDVAHFSEPAASKGRMLCFAAINGFSIASEVVIDKEGIATMLGGKTDLKTFRTMIALATIPPGVLQTQKLPTDADGRNILPTAGRGQFGFTIVPPPPPP